MTKEIVFFKGVSVMGLAAACGGEAAGSSRAFARAGVAIRILPQPRNAPKPAPPPAPPVQNL
ncbi:hypothetical protein [Burkholderia stagnalis]|uniref:hypothetical protein n=1 Tax=Burkholderia stagnalis TaxID=1503054 RepID=UPI000F57CA9C|nr:hypothetical protein [Burkholderia stagnalis]